MSPLSSFRLAAPRWRPQVGYQGDQKESATHFKRLADKIVCLIAVPRCEIRFMIHENKRKKNKV